MGPPGGRQVVAGSGSLCTVWAEGGRAHSITERLGRLDLVYRQEEARNAGSRDGKAPGSTGATPARGPAQAAPRSDGAHGRKIGPDPLRCLLLRCSNRGRCWNETRWREEREGMLGRRSAA